MNTSCIHCIEDQIYFKIHKIWLSRSYEDGDYNFRKDWKNNNEITIILLIMYNNSTYIDGGIGPSILVMYTNSPNNSEAAGRLV